MRKNIIICLIKKHNPAVLQIITAAAYASICSRLYGVGPVFARIICDAGIKSVKTFIKYRPEELISIYENKTKKKADFGVNDISFSIELTKELET